MSEEKGKLEGVIRDDSVEDRETIEAFDMAAELNPKTDVYVCDICGWEYDPELGYPEGGIAPGTRFEDLPDDFVCPLCGAGKDEFSPRVEINPDDGGTSVTNA